MEGAGYPMGPPASPMPEMHRRWLPVSGEVADFLVDFSAAQGRSPVPWFASHEPLFNTNTVRLAAFPFFHRGLDAAGQLDGNVDGDPVAAYRERLSSAEPNFLITADPAPMVFLPRVEPSDAEEAARSLGFELVKTISLPDGREARIWWLDQGPALPKAKTS